MSTTINKEEIQKFSKLADEWWDVNGKFKPLHMFNPIRIEYITDFIKNHFKIKVCKYLYDILYSSSSSAELPKSRHIFGKASKCCHR